MLTPEIKRLCEDLVEEHCVFNFDDAIALCSAALKNMELCQFEYDEALAHIAIGLEEEELYA